MSDEDEYYTVDPGAALHKNPKFIQALGDITYNSAWLEGTLTSILADMNNGSATYALVAEMSFSNTLNATRAVIDSIALEGRAKRYLLAVLARAQTVYDYRNVVVHSMWFGVESSDEEFVALRHRVKGKWIRHERFVTLTELQDIAVDIANVNARLMTFTHTKAFKQRKMFVVCRSCGHQY